MCLIERYELSIAGRDSTGKVNIFPSRTANPVITPHVEIGVLRVDASGEDTSGRRPGEKAPDALKSNPAQQDQREHHKRHQEQQRERRVRRNAVEVVELDALDQGRGVGVDGPGAVIARVPRRTQQTPRADDQVRRDVGEEEVEDVRGGVGGARQLLHAGEQRDVRAAGVVAHVVVVHAGAADGIGAAQGDAVEGGSRHVVRGRVAAQGGGVARQVEVGFAHGGQVGLVGTVLGHQAPEGSDIAQVQLEVLNTPEGRGRVVVIHLVGDADDLCVAQAGALRFELDGFDRGFDGGCAGVDGHGPAGPLLEDGRFNTIHAVCCAEQKSAAHVDVANIRAVQSASASAEEPWKEDVSSERPCAGHTGRLTGFVEIVLVDIPWVGVSRRVAPNACAYESTGVCGKVEQLARAETLELSEICVPEERELAADVGVEIREGLSLGGLGVRDVEV